jgi:hypothetical protein
MSYKKKCCFWYKKKSNGASHIFLVQSHIFLVSFPSPFPPPPIQLGVLGDGESVFFDLYVVRLVAWSLSLLPLAVVSIILSVAGLWLLLIVAAFMLCCYSAVVRRFLLTVFMLCC